MTQTVVLKVGMSCQGCAGAVTRALNKMEGVDSFEVDIKEQKVTVNGNVQPEAVLQTVSKTGKKTELWEGAAAPVKTVAPPVETVPTPVETVPAPAETVPASAETVPAPAETVPAPAETAAASAETVPAPAETVAAPVETVAV